DVFFYWLSWKDGCRWLPICPSLAPAIPVTGRWNYDQGVPGGGSKTPDPSFITWGCLRSAIGKCVLLGYKPWKSVDGTSLEPYHQTCVRLLRADFCGDGMAYTIDGRLLNLYDRLNIQRDTEPWNFEAEWDTDGARCMTDEHRTNGSPI